MRKPCTCRLRLPPSLRQTNWPSTSRRSGPPADSNWYPLTPSDEAGPRSKKLPRHCARVHAQETRAGERSTRSLTPAADPKARPAMTARCRRLAYRLSGDAAVLHGSCGTDRRGRSLGKDKRGDRAAIELIIAGYAVACQVCGRRLGQLSFFRMSALEPPNHCLRRSSRHEVSSRFTASA